MATVYEWAAELERDGEIFDVQRADTIADASEALLAFDAEKIRLVLIRETGDDTRGLTGRLWAYARNGMLPSYFEDADGSPTHTAVPKRFHREIASHVARFGNEFDE